MSYAEARRWFAYRERYGGIGHARAARLLALTAWTLNRAHGGDATFEQVFYLQEPEPTIQDAMNELLKAL